MAACLAGLTASVSLAQADAPTPVQTAALTPTTWRPTIEVAAQIDAMQSATLAAERPGRVTAILFTSGQTVAAGALLVKLDDTAEQAQLALDQAKLTEAENTLIRSRKLLTIQGASQAALEQATADVAENRAQLAADGAAVAQLNITAPFAGTLGIRKISAGDYVAQGQTVAQITQTAPLRVLFSIPQTEAGGITTGEPFTLAAATIPGNPITANGTITALSPMVDTNTNARDAEGLITDKTTALLPGMFGTITLQTGTPQPAYQVPDTALNDSVLGRYIFALQPSGANFTLHTIYVTQLAQSGKTATIATTGLAPTTRIVSLGGFKLTDGTTVTPERP
jgi:RND family efflux transporter MFP subunit